VPEVVKDGVTGFVLPPGDAEALAAKVEVLLAEPETAQRLGSEGREWVRSRFSAERLVDDLTALYDELLERRGMARKPPG
jgi:glycosyltransferase involved in cell wall biosynthesis